MTTFGGLATIVAVFAASVLVAYLALFPAAFAVIFARSRRAFGFRRATVLAPVHLGDDRARAAVRLGRLPVGAARLQPGPVLPVAQVASVVGVYGLSWMLALAAAAAAALVARTRPAALDVRRERRGGVVVAGAAWGTVAPQRFVAHIGRRAGARRGPAGQHPAGRQERRIHGNLEIGDAINAALHAT